MAKPFTRHAGCGLGLSVVEQTAKVHGGHLHLKHNLLRGLEVQLWLPLDSFATNEGVSKAMHMDAVSK
jgi:signal transduction histidine kinase